MADEYYTKKQLKEHGWTERLIRMFYPKPDMMAPNYINKEYSQMYKFSVSRVRSIESTEKFQREREKIQRRRLAKRKAV